MDAPIAVVTLIHGTGAAKGTWTGETGEICRGLREGFGGRVYTDVFKWSGWNLHRSRAAAGWQLREHIRDNARRFPGVRQILIAHSHGGTVAAYALRDASRESGVAGLALLATPFYRCAPRSLSSVSLAITLSLGTCALAMLVWFLYAVLSDDVTLLGSLAIAFGVVVYVSLTSNAIRWAARSVVRRFSTRRRELIEKMSVKLPKDIPVLVLHPATDEARTYLGLWRLAEKVLYWLLNLRSIWAIAAVWSAIGAFALSRGAGNAFLAVSSLGGAGMPRYSPQWEASHGGYGSVLDSRAYAIQATSVLAGIVLGLAVFIVVYVAIVAFTCRRSSENVVF